MDFPIGKKLFPERRRARYPMGHQDGCRVGNNWNWYKVQETCKWNTKFLSEYSNREIGPTFLDFSLFPGNFQWDEPTKHIPFSIDPKFPKILTKWKAPKVYADFPKETSERRKKQWPRLKKAREDGKIAFFSKPEPYKLFIDGRFVPL